MKLLLSGPPGTGKTHLGRWLSRYRAFYHFDMENWTESESKKLWDQGRIEEFVKSLDRFGSNIVLSWGFPPNPCCLALIATMNNAGVEHIWLDAPVLFCRSHWQPNEQQAEDSFTQQINSISEAWKEIGNLFNRRSVCVINSDFEYLAEAELIEQIFIKIEHLRAKPHFV